MSVASWFARLKRPLRARAVELRDRFYLVKPGGGCASTQAENRGDVKMSATTLEQLHKIKMQFAAELVEDAREEQEFALELDASLRHLSALTGVPYEGIETKRKTTAPRRKSL